MPEEPSHELIEAEDWAEYWRLRALRAEEAFERMRAYAADLDARREELQTLLRLALADSRNAE